MKSHRHLMVAMILFLSSCATTYAPKANHPKSHEGSVEALFELIKMGEVFPQIIDRTLTVQLQQNPHLTPFRHVLEEFFNQYMSWESIKPDLVKIYMEAFTKEEVDALADFYRTDVGQKAAKLLPELSQKGMLIGQKRIQDNLPKLEQMVAAEIQRAQIETAPAPPAPDPDGKSPNPKSDGEAEKKTEK